MKKLLFVILFSALFVNVAFAEIIPIQGNGNPMLVGQPWGLSGYQTPRIESGTTFSDKYGVSFTCPFWFGFMGCFDLTKTEWYMNYQTVSAKNLLQKYGNNAFTLYPYFSGWLNSVK